MEKIMTHTKEFSRASTRGDEVGSIVDNERANIAEGSTSSEASNDNDNDDNDAMECDEEDGGARKAQAGKEF
jgi:hypothetical protein